MFCSSIVVLFVVFFLRISDLTQAAFSYGNTTTPSITIPPTAAATSTNGDDIIFSAITNLTLRSYCETVLSELYLTYEDTALPITTVRTITEDRSGLTGFSGPVDTTVYETDTYVVPFTPILKAPCCAQCSILANMVQIRYWPTPAPTPLVTEIVSDGFTYISPSVYVVFQTINAYDLCGHVGGDYGNVTQSYGQDELSTYAGYAAAYGGSAPVVPLDYADLSQNCSQSYSVDSSGTSSYLGDQCLPWLVAPSQIAEIDPAWAICTGAIDGFYDPPYALTAAKIITTAEPLPISTPASPGSSGTALPESTGGPAPAPSMPLSIPIAPSTASTVFDPQPVSTPLEPVSPPASSASSPSIVKPAPSSNLPVPSPPTNPPDPSSNLPVPPPPIVPHTPSSSDLGSSPSTNPPSPLSKLPFPSPPFIPPAPLSDVPGSSPAPNPPALPTAVSLPNQVSNPATSAAASQETPADPSTYNPNSRVTPTAASSNNIPPVVIASGSFITEGSPPVIIGGSTTTIAGGTPAVIGGQTVVLSSGILHVGTSTLSIASQEPGSPPQSTPIVVGGLTFSPAPSPTAPQSSETPVIIGGATVSVLPSGSAILIGTQTLLPGSAATISGTPISLSPSDLVIGAPSGSIPLTTIAIPQPLGGAAPAEIITIGGQTVTAAATGFAIGSTMLTPGGSGITVSGTLVSLAADGTLVIGSSTITLPTAPVDGLTIAGQTVTPAATGFVVDGTTLMPGASGITVSGTLVSLGVGGTLVLGTETLVLPTAAGSALGSGVLSAFAPAGTGVGGATATIQLFAGGAEKMRGCGEGGWLMVLAVVVWTVMGV